MKAQLRSALTLFVLLTLVTGVAYPALVTLVAQGVFSHRANGSVLTKGDKRVGSELIGQFFDGPSYFRGRPSATQKDDKDFPYNAAASGGSNLGPTNAALVGGEDIEKEPGAIRERIKKLKDAHGSSDPVPVDLVTASASGLDPHISPAAAEYQVSRVAKVRGKTVEEIRKIVSAHTEGRTFGVLGEPRVNVLRLNIALDDAR